MISNWKSRYVVAECFKESHGNFPNGATWIVRRRWLTGKCLLYKCSTLWRYVNTLWSPSSAWSTVFNGHFLACFRSFLSGLSNLSEGQFFPSRKTRHIPTIKPWWAISKFCRPVFQDASHVWRLNLFVRGRYTTFSVFPGATQLTGSFLLVPFSSLICLQTIRRAEIDLNLESWPVSQYGSGVRLCSSWHGGGLPSSQSKSLH